MKEITRIHLAKVAYDIELDAKHELERYVTALSKHADEEVMNDIESRMVELLAERGVKAGGVITHVDVADLRHHLGEPKDFADQSETKPSEKMPLTDDKRLYRDMDNALLGGVSSGLAAYFRIDPVIVRIIFVVLAVSSLGWGMFIYAALWFLVPPAKTAGEKLSMQGKPITAATIKEFSEREFTNERVMAIRNFLSTAGGVGMAVVAFGIFAGTVIKSLSIILNSGMIISGLLVAVVGTLATWFCIALATVLLRQDFTPQSANKLAIIATLTVVSLCGLVAWYTLVVGQMTINW